MITPRRVFLSFMVMISLLPLPILSSTVAVTLTWAVLGLRKALLILLVSMSYGFFMVGNFSVELYQSLTYQAHAALVAVQSCVSACTTTPSFVTATIATLSVIERVLPVVIVANGVTWGLIYWRVRKIRAYSSGIRKFYWGPAK